MVSLFFIGLIFQFILFTSSADDDSFDGGLQGVEIAPKVLTNVPYGNSRLSVWGHLNNPNLADDKKKYFVMPVVMLLPNKSKCQWNIFTGEITLQLRFLMWNEDFASAVLTHLRKVTSLRQLQISQVTTLPMEQMRLVWANSVQQLQSHFKVNADWKSYANQDNIISFEFVVSSKEFCNRALKQLQERPDSLGSLELQYVLHGTRASRKQITVTGQHLLQGEMYSKMRNKVGSGGNVYLNSEDLNKFTNEAASAVTASSMTDADYIDTGDSVSLSKLIYDSISTFKQTTTTMTPKMWESTFWQDEFTRPDKLTSYLNDVITKNHGKEHTVHVNDKYNHKEGSVSISLGIPGLFSGGASASGKTIDKTHVSDDKLRTWLKDKNYKVQWTGEKFTVKPVDLYRLNTQQLAQRQNIATTYVQVHQVQYTYNVKVSFPNDVMNNGSYVTTSAINKRLEELEETDKKQATAIKEQLEDIKKETAATNKRLDATKDNVNSKIHSINANLNPLQRLRNNKLCQNFYTPYTHTCSENREIGYCVCFLFSGDKSQVYYSSITNNGRTCKCINSNKHAYGTCCLHVN